MTVPTRIQRSSLINLNMLIGIQGIFAAGCALSVFLYALFNIDEIKAKQKIVIERAQSEQSSNIKSAQDSQREAIRLAQEKQAAAIRKIQENQKR